MRSSHGAAIKLLGTRSWIRTQSKEDYLPEFLTLVLFSLESLITKCLIHRVGAVISRKKKERERKVCAYMEREVTTQSVSQTCNKLLEAYASKLSYLPLDTSTSCQCQCTLSSLWRKRFSPPACKRQPGHPVPGHRVVRIQRHQATPSRNKNIIPGGEEHGPSQVPLSCFPGRRFKGDKSTNGCQTHRRDHFRGNSWSRADSARWASASCGERGVSLTHTPTPSHSQAEHTASTFI